MNSIRLAKQWAVKHKLMNFPANCNKFYIPTQFEHCANTYTHGLMIIPSVLALKLLLTKIEKKFNDFGNSDEKHLYEICFYLYGFCMMLVFIFSSAYHWVCWIQSSWTTFKNKGCSNSRPLLSRCLHQCDRSIIYVFIAASYTPWMVLCRMDNPFSGFQWIVWSAAVIGTLYSLYFLEKNKLVEILLYLLVGVSPGIYMILFNSSKIDQSAAFETCLGGLFYIVGVFIFKLDGHLPFAHAIWHLFVIAGAFTHYLSISRFFFI